jgi:hypothetical protein
MPATLALHTEALEIYRELGDNRGAAQALADLGFHALDARDVPRAKALLDEAAAFAGPLNDARLTAHIQHIRGVIASAEGDFQRAYALEEESLSHYQQIGDTWLEIIVAWNVGVNGTVLGHFDDARAHLTMCLKVGLELGNRWGTSYPLEALATLAMAEHRVCLAPPTRTATVPVSFRRPPSIPPCEPSPPPRQISTDPPSTRRATKGARSDLTPPWRWP